MGITGRDPSDPSLPTELVRFSSPAGRWVLAATVLGSGVASLDATVVNVALPRLGQDLNADFAGLQWVITAYTLTLASLILLGGALGDRFGRRRVFCFGLVWFAVASAACAAAPTIGVLIAARLVQGVGGALLTPGSLALLSAAFHPADRARAIGAWSGLGGVTTAIGPFVGGWLTGAASWRWIFLLNLPLIAAVLAIAVRHVPESHDPTATGRIDGGGAVLGAGGLALTTYALIEQQGVIGVVGVVALVTFVVVEARTLHPMLPPGIFRNRQFSAANGLTFVVYGALGMVLFLVGLVLQTALGYSPIQAGASLLPITLIMLLFSARSGALAQRIGPRLQLSVGPVVVGAGMVLLTRIEPGATYATTVLPAVVLFGIGLALTVAPLTATVLAAADVRHAGVASGVNNAVARSAGLLAVAAIPLLTGLNPAAGIDPVALVDGFHTASLIGAAACALGGLVGLLAISNSVLSADGTAQAEPCFHCPLDATPLAVTEADR